MSELITDEELLNLPEDRIEAFLKLYEIADGRLKQLLSELQSDVAAEHHVRKYMALMLAVADEYGIDALHGWDLPNFDSSNMHSYRPFHETLDRCVAGFRLKRARRTKQFSVALDAATKEKLRHLIGQMRAAIDKLEISVAKKDRLFRCINDLAAEIDLERTRLQSVGSLFVELCDDVGEAAERLQPIVVMFERIAAALGYSKRKEDESVGLPRPEETKRISGPKKRPQSSDDEIPF